MSRLCACSTASVICINNRAARRVDALHLVEREAGIEERGVHAGLLECADLARRAIAHAVADALLGAAGLGDIGEHFPDTDPQWKGAYSLTMLAHVGGLVRDDGWTIGNVDCAVVCELPKLAPRRAEMQAKLSEACGAPVSIKGRRAEGLGALGRQEGIACWAVAVIMKEHP